MGAQLVEGSAVVGSGVNVAALLVEGFRRYEHSTTRREANRVSGKRDPTILP